jgi:hypothetical protein
MSKDITDAHNQEKIKNNRENENKDPVMVMNHLQQ